MYYKIFKTAVEVVESQWGLLTPTKIGTKKDTRNAFLACVFMSGLDGKYAALIADLNNAYATGNKNVYPNSVEEVANLVSTYRDGKNEKKARDQKNEDLFHLLLPVENVCHLIGFFVMSKQGLM